ncbi:MAG: NADH-quinone oxidoreductase subunit N [Candidatus Marsarchaeota archaeon]|jgi:NADH-quinone oxidoreductase subunit N|nr:NADH-quinone oxidoreductase subunit N [Candidatus Marsarchaeota archaeon]MCL5418655.1 NADH-quinone oxidoreductase subunit N [Candidatus Marsarchaeota archaeon]
MHIISLALVFAAALLAVFGIASAMAKSRRFALASGMVLLAFAAILSAYLLGSGANYTMLGIVHIYPFSMLFVLLFSVLMMLIEVLSFASKNFAGMQILIGFAFIALLVVPSATSIIEIFIGLELFSVMVTFMIIIEGKSHTEAAVKFFVLSAASIALFSAALALMLPYNGSMLLAPASASLAAGSAMLLLALVFFIAAMSFDTAMFPFNLWVPDVYEGASANVTATIAGIGKKLSFVALIEVLFVFFASSGSIYSPLLALLSVLTMFYGNFAAMVQKRVRRLFAYSSISQAGYIMIGVAVATQYGVEASIVQIIAHAFMIIGAFALIMWLETINIRSIDDYSGLASRSRFAAVSLTIIMLSMAGIPPLLGFDGKLLLFSSAISANMLILAVLGVVNSFLSIYYYGKLISVMFTQKERRRIPLNIGIAAVVVVVLAVVVVLGIYPEPVIHAASMASSSLFSLASSP